MCGFVIWKSNPDPDISFKDRIENAKSKYCTLGTKSDLYGFELMVDFHYCKQSEEVVHEAFVCI